MAPVELLQEDDTRQLVRERERSEREAMCDISEFQAKWSADHEAEVLAAVPASLQKRAEGHRVHGLAIAVQQRDETAPREPPGGLRVLADLDQLEPRVA
jgi:hypothetical protein